MNWTRERSLVAAFGLVLAAAFFWFRQAASDVEGKGSADEPRHASATDRIAAADPVPLAASPERTHFVPEAMEESPPNEDRPADRAVQEEAGGVQARFLDEHGTPLAGVQLCVFGEPDAALSGNDGVARLARDAAFFDGSTHTFEAFGLGFAREQREAQAKPGKTLLLGDWSLVPGGTVAGRVVDRSGNGIAGVRVGCIAEPFSEAEWERARRDPLEWVWRPGAQARTERDGAFRLEDAPAGTHRLVATAEDRPSSVTPPLEIPVAGLLGGVVLEMEDADGGTTIAGLVLDPLGRPVPGAGILASSRGSTIRMSAGEDGRFRLLCADKKPRDLTAFDPEQKLREAVRLGVLPGTTDLELRLQVAPEVELRVQAADGTPIERFAVALLDREKTVLSFFGERSHPRGVFVWSAPGQDFLVEVRSNGWLPERLGPYPAAQLPARIDCRLSAASGIHGRVTARGEPVAGATVALHAATTKNDTHNGFPVRSQLEAENETHSDDDGEFSLSVEQPGTYYLRVTAEGFAPAELGPLSLSPSREHEQDVELGLGGSLRVQVRSEAGAAVSGALVAISRGDGRAFTERTDEGGSLTFEGLTPGPWQVQLSNEEIDARYGSTRFGSKPVGEIPSNCRVFEGELTRVDLWLGESSGACRLSGRLTIDGRPAQGWHVGLDQERAAALEPIPLLEPGLFRLAVAEPGSYRLRLSVDAADPSAMLILMDPLELVEGEQFWSLEFETGALEGRMDAPDEDSVVFYRWRKGTVEGYVPLVPDADGRVRCPHVPAGSGAIVRTLGNTPLEEQTPIVLRELRVPAQGTLQFEL